MSEKEKSDAKTIAEAYVRMNETQKSFFVGYAQGVSDACSSRERTEEKADETAESN